MPNDPLKKPKIYVAIFGNKANVKQVMKQWRTSKVDVDAKNKPCLERMMSVIEESSIYRMPSISSFDDESEIDCSFEDFLHLVSRFDTSWAQNMRKDIHNNK